MLAEEDVIQNPVPEEGLTESRALSGKLDMHMPWLLLQTKWKRGIALFPAYPNQRCLFYFTDFCFIYIYILEYRESEAESLWFLIAWQPLGMGQRQASVGWRTEEK